MNGMFLHVYYDSESFDTAYLTTVSGAGRTERKLTRAQAAVYQVWFSHHSYVKVDRYEAKRSTYVAFTLIKV